MEKAWRLVTLSIAFSILGISSPSHGQTRDPKPEAVEDEMLKDLELFRQTDLGKEREFFRMLNLMGKIPFLERLRMEPSPPPRQPEKR